MNNNKNRVYTEGRAQGRCPVMIGTLTLLTIGAASAEGLSDFPLEIYGHALANVQFYEAI